MEIAKKYHITIKTMEIAKKYYVTYLDKDDDCTTVWTMASSKQEAIENVKDEYWDVQRVIDCYSA